MANRFWVGGTGTWNNSSTANWSTTSGGASGASAPTSSDDVFIDANSGGGAITIASGAACRNLTVTWTAARTNSITLSANFAPAGTVSIDGNSAVNRILIQSSTVGTARALTIGTLSSLTNTDFMDIAGAGAASPFSGTSVGDCQGNSGITFTPPTTQHFTNVNGGNWGDIANWTSRVPLPQDDVLVDASFGAGKTVTIDMPRIGKNLNCAGAGAVFTLASGVSGGSPSYFGDITLKSGSTFSGGQSQILRGRGGAQNINSNGVTWTGALVVSAPGGTYRFQDAYTTTSTSGIALNAGTLNANGFNVTTPTVTIANTGITRALLMGAGTWTLNATSGNVWNVASASLFTLTPSVSTMVVSDTGASSKTFIGGGLTYANLTITGGGAGAVILTGSNTFARLTVGAPKTVQFTAGTTTTVTTMTINGSAGNVITLHSTIDGNTWNIVGTASKVSGDWLAVKNSAASGTLFFAGLNSTNEGDNSGWSFALPSPTPAVVVYGPAGSLGSYATDGTQEVVGTNHPLEAYAVPTLSFDAGATPGTGTGIASDGKVMLTNTSIVGNLYKPTSIELAMSEWDTVGRVLRTMVIPTSLGFTTATGSSGLVGGASSYWIVPGTVGGVEYVWLVIEHPYGPDYQDWQRSVRGGYPIFAAFKKTNGLWAYDSAHSWTAEAINAASGLGAIVFPLATNGYSESYGNDLALADCAFAPASGHLLCSQYFSNPAYPDAKGGSVFAIDLATGIVTANLSIPWDADWPPGHANPFALIADPTGRVGREAFSVKFDQLGRDGNVMMVLNYDSASGTIEPLTNFLETGDGGNNGWGHGVFDTEGWLYWNTNRGLFAGELYCWPKRDDGTWDFETGPESPADPDAPQVAIARPRARIELTGGFGTSPLRYDPVTRCILYPGGSTVLVPVQKRGGARAPQLIRLPHVIPELGAHVDPPYTINPGAMVLDPATREVHWAIGEQDQVHTYPVAPFVLPAWMLRFNLDALVNVPFRDAATAGNVLVSSFTATLPDYEPGDLAIVAVFSGLTLNDAAITPPDGWTCALEQTNTTLGKRYAIYWRVLEEGDADPVFLNPNGTATYEAVVTATYAAPNPDAPIDSIAATLYGTSLATFTAPAVTTTRPGCRLLRLFLVNQTVVTWTPGTAELTVRATKNGVLGAGGSVLLAEDTDFQAAPGASATATYSIDTATPIGAPYAAAVTIALAPAPDPDYGGPSAPARSGQQRDSYWS